MTTQDAKAYISKRSIPQLFESLLTGLMYNRPEDHVTYLQNCLQQIQGQDEDLVRWNLFIEQQRKTPLPPIPTDRNKSPTFRKDPSFITETPPKTLEERKGSPLPPIGQTWNSSAAKSSTVLLPKCPIVLVFGGPGSGRATQCRRLVKQFHGWVHLSMGDLLRQETMQEGSVDEKWGMVGRLVDKGEMAPEDVTIELIQKSIQQLGNPAGVLIEGYPRTLQQLQEYDQLIGRVDLAFVLDCEEENLYNRLAVRGKRTGRVDDNDEAIEARLKFFKENTLPVLKHFDDRSKLVVVDGDRDVDEIFYELTVIFSNVFFGKSTAEGAPAYSPVPHPPSSPKPQDGSRASSGRFRRPGSSTSTRVGSGISRVPTQVEITLSDMGRKPDMPKCPIILLMGGPGSGRGTQAQRILQSYPGVQHVSVGDVLRQEIMKKQGVDAKWNMVGTIIQDGNMAPEDITVDLVKSSLQKHQDAKAILLEGYPRNKEQVAEFNQHVGGADLVMLLDCDEYFMRERLTSRAASTGRPDDNQNAITNRIRYFKYETLPIIGHYEDRNKLTVIPCDRDRDEVFYDICLVLDLFLNNRGVRGDQGGIDIPKALDVAVPDSGRKPGYPDCLIFSVLGGPGSGVQEQSKLIVKKYSDFIHIPQKQAPSVSSIVKDNMNAKAILLEGFPTNKAELEDFNSSVGGMNCVIVLDRSQETSKGDPKQIDDYKKTTLPVLGYYDDRGKLAYIDAERDTEAVFANICNVIDYVVKKSAGDGQNSPQAMTQLDLSVPDSGRRAGLPSCPIVSVIGGPNSGSDVVCKKLTEKFTGTVHLDTQNMKVDDILSSLKQNQNAKALVLEEFPLVKTDIDQFNQQVGGMDRVLVLDRSEDSALKAGVTADRLSNYKSDTLPVLGHYDDNNKLHTVNTELGAEKTLEVVSEIMQDVLNKSTQENKS